MNNFGSDHIPITYDPATALGAVLLSNQNLTVSTGAVASTFNHAVRATESKETGKWYWEVRLDEGNASWICVTMETSSDTSLTWQNYTSGYRTDGMWKDATGGEFSVPSIGAIADIIGVALNMDEKTLQFYRNDEVITDRVAISEATKAYPAIWSTASSTGNTITTTNFGAELFSYSAPEGFLPYDVNNDLKISLLLGD